MSTVLITGSSSGIGLELAKVCAKNGHDVVLVARNKTDVNDQVFENVRVTNLMADLSKPGAAKKLYQTVINKKIKVDILINNAGIGDYDFFAEADFKKIQTMMQLNMLALTEITHLFVNDMKKEEKGKIMNLASTAAFLPGPFMAVYYATKHYVLAFSEALAEELRPYNITVTALCPGPTESGFQNSSNMARSRLVKGRSLPTSKEVAEYGYNSMKSGKRVAVHGIINKIIVLLPRLLPRNFITKTVFNASKPTK